MNKHPELAGLAIPDPMHGAGSKLSFILGYLKASAVNGDPLHPDDCAALVVAACRTSHGLEMGSAMIEFM